MNYLNLKAMAISITVFSWTVLSPSLTAFGYDDVTARRLVRQAYCRILERPVDENGIVSYGGALRGDMTAKQMIFELAISPEHRSKFLNKNTPEQYVNILYEQLLARQADPTGLENWTNLLANQGYVGVIRGIMDSPEYNNKWGNDKVPGNGRAGCQ
jgi:hypothetical protein